MKEELEALRAQLASKTMSWTEQKKVRLRNYRRKKRLLALIWDRMSYHFHMMHWKAASNLCDRYKRVQDL